MVPPVRDDQEEELQDQGSAQRQKVESKTPGARPDGFRYAGQPESSSRAGGFLRLLRLGNRRLDVRVIAAQVLHRRAQGLAAAFG